MKTIIEMAREAGIRDCTCDGTKGCLERFASLVRADERARMAEQPAQQEPVLQDIEQHRLQMAGISTAAIGYWKEGDGIHPDYDTVALRDVAKLYAKYDELYRAQQQEPVAYWIPKAEQFCIADPSGRPFAKAWEPLYTSPPAQRTWVGLTDEEIDKIPCELYAPDQGGMTMEEGLQVYARAIEAKLKEKNT